MQVTYSIKYWGLCGVAVSALSGWPGTADTGVAPKTPTFHSAKRCATFLDFLLND